MTIKRLTIGLIVLVVLIVGGVVVYKGTARPAPQHVPQADVVVAPSDVTVEGHLEIYTDANVENFVGLKLNTWYLVEDGDGQYPPAVHELSFDANAVCKNGSTTVSCESALVNGKAAQVAGAKNADGVVRVTVLAVEGAVSHASQ